MAKVTYPEVRLIDDQGYEWARASISPTNLKRIIKDYQRLEIYLREELVNA